MTAAKDIPGPGRVPTPSGAGGATLPEPHHGGRQAHLQPPGQALLLPGWVGPAQGTSGLAGSPLKSGCGYPQGFPLPTNPGRGASLGQMLLSLLTSRLTTVLPVPGPRGARPSLRVQGGPLWGPLQGPGSFTCHSLWAVDIRQTLQGPQSGCPRCLRAGLDFPS